MSKKTLYLIDGHAQIYRAYYAPFAPLTSPTGEPTRAVHVFIQMLLGLLRDKRPDYLAMTLDVGDQTVFRVQIDPEYKANRDPPPEDLPPQIDRIISVLEAMKVPILRLKGFEADDIMATLCEEMAGDDLDVLLVSRDKDLDQLLNDHVRLYDPGKDRVIDEASMREEKGYGPELAVEAQMLMGDSTDNVKGVVGVGPKKAAQLLEKYGSVASIIEHAEELTPKLKESVLAFKDRQDVVRKLVTLRRDVPLRLDLAEADVQRIDAAAAAPLLREMGLNKLTELVSSYAAGLKKMAPSAGKKEQDSGEKDVNRKAAEEGRVVGAQAGLFDAMDHAPSPQRASQPRGKYELVDSEKKLEDLALRLAKVKSFAFDTETTASAKELATNPAFAEIAGLSISWEAKTGCYIPIRGVGDTVSEVIVRRALGPVFADASVCKCGQNIKFDIRVLKNIGIEVAGIDFDTMIASFVIDSTRRSHGMNWLSQELLGYQPIPIEEVIGKGRDQKVFEQVSTQTACEYAAEDADVTWRLREALEKQLTDDELVRLFRDLEMPLVDVLVGMEHAGISLDTNLTARLSGEMADRMSELEEQIHKAAGRPFNLDSTKQLAEVLYDERKLPVLKRTKTGRSTDAEVLEQLSVQTADPIPKLLLEYREITKLKGTYVDALPEMVSPRTGRIHPNFSQIGAITGRLSCSDPNLQNIPIRTPMGAQIRRAFVPGDSDSVLIKADYSQIELRVLAHFSKDKALAAAFAEDRDIHAFVASQIDGVPLESVTAEQRSRAKTVNFGIIYGQSAFGLARQTGMSQSDAKIFIERYFARYPRIRGFLDECIAHAKKHGFVKTMLGRRRAIPDINSRNQTARNAAERLAVNTVVQGTAADLIKRAMINLHHRIAAEKLPMTMLVQVHDELVFETPRAQVERMKPIIADEMSGAMKLDVPIRVDVASGLNWLDVE
jgi:DNA polymerase-1